MRRALWLVVAVCALCLLVAVSVLIALPRWDALVDADQVGHQEGLGAALESGQPAGQTFAARHAGLAGIEFFLVTENAVPVSVTLHLRTDPESQVDLATASLQLPAKAGSAFYRFSFPPLEMSHGQYYYAFLQPSQGGVSIALSDGAKYLDGAAHRAHEPLDAQTTFRLVYSPGLVILDLLKTVLRWAGLLAVAGLLFVVPGWALLAWLLPGRRLGWAEMLGLAAGVSLALYPLLLLWTHLVGLSLGALYAWIPVAVGVAVLAWHYRGWRPQHSWESWQAWTHSQNLWPDLTLLMVLALVLGARLLVVRTLEAPLWGDSYQHTMMTQLLLDNGGLFNSWEPYTPYRGLTMHFGFPTTAAVLDWVLGAGGVQATLLTGQLLNGLAALTLYPLAVRLADGNRWAGVGAVLVAGILSPMPAYYVNWGRYAQLAGQVVLPVALWLVWEVIQEEKTTWKAVALAGGVAAGMALAYYRMPVYYAVFIVAWLIGWGLSLWRTSARAWLGGLLRLASIAGIALLLLLPVGFRVAGGRLADGLGAGMSSVSPLDDVLRDYQVWRSLPFFMPWSLLFTALVALAWGLWQKRWIVLSVGLATVGWASLVAGRLFRLPGANYLQSFAVLIALYIPVSLLVGWLVGQLAELLRGRSREWVMAVFLVVLAGWAGIGQTKLVQPEFVMVTRPDTQAMAWIRDHTPTEARILVEGYRIYNGSSAVGSDAGWWIPLLTDRQNTMPPQYALFNETPIEAGYSRDVVNLVAQLETVALGSPEGTQLLCDRDISYVYVGQMQGMVGYAATQLFSPLDLMGEPAFRLAYHRDRVWIFALDLEKCGTSL